MDDQENNEFVVNDFEWHRLYEPNVRENVNFDLNHNFEAFKHNPFYDIKIDLIQKFILKTTNESTSLVDSVHGCNLVTNRGTLFKIGAFHSLEYFHKLKVYGEFYFQKISGVIFGCQRISDERKAQEQCITPLERKKADYWGHKFGQYMTTETPNVSYLNLNFITYSFID